MLWYSNGLSPVRARDVSRQDTRTSFRDLAYGSEAGDHLSDIYDRAQPIRFDKRWLSEGLGVRRSPRPLK